MTGNVDDAVAAGSKSASVTTASAGLAKVIVCLDLTLKVLMTSVAAVYVLPPIVPPACDAVRLQLPGPTSVTTSPVTVQTLVVVEV